MLLTERHGRSASALISSPSAPQTSLENLPVEVQALILSQTPNLPSLRALVHSSPTLHQVYSGDRLRILQSVLDNVVGGMVLEALATPQCETMLSEEAIETFFGWPVHKDDKARYDMPESYWLDQLGLGDMIRLLQFHSRVIEPLTEQYVNWALTSLHTSPEEQAIWQQPLRTTERRRIQRAMYRLQIFNDANDYFHGSQRVRLLSMFPPWELEQILCVLDFARDIKSDALVYCDLTRNMVYFVMREQIRADSAYDSAQHFRQGMSFSGDILDSPPLAWVLFWREDESSLYGDHADEDLRRFGYVMWDAARLGQTAQARIHYLAGHSNCWSGRATRALGGMHSKILP
jgi:hypothetical protein